MCSRPLASARSVPGSGCRWRYAPAAVAVRRGSTTMCRAPFGPPGVQVLHGRRHGVGRVRADQQHGPAPRRCRRAGTAARGRCRARGSPRWPRTTCRTGRCSRSTPSAAPPGRTCRACTPSRWSARRRRTRRRCPARTAAGLAGSRRRPASSASSQLASRSGLVRSPGTLRTSGVSSRSGWSSSSAAVQPLAHRPPRLTGKSVGSSRTDALAPGVSAMPHCSAQYGQCVSVTGMSPMLAVRRFPADTIAVYAGVRNFLHRRRRRCEAAQVGRAATRRRAGGSRA